MKKIGLIGGLTWVSTVDYYRLLNELVNERKGGSEAAEKNIFLPSTKHQIIDITE
jgi:aspartate racemase